MENNSSTASLKDSRCSSIESITTSTTLLDDEDYERNETLVDTEIVVIGKFLIFVI